MNKHKPHISKTKIAYLLIKVVFLSACTSTSLDRDGNLIIRSFGINQNVYDSLSTQYIDLRDSSIVGMYSDSSVTIGYKNRETNRVHYSCRTLIVTNKYTQHDNVIEFINDILSRKACSVPKQAEANKSHLNSKNLHSLKLGYSTIAFSSTFPPDRGITAYRLNFFGVEFGSVYGTGFRSSSVISSGNQCIYLLVAETQNDFEYYKSNLDFNRGKHLCIALKP